MKIQMTIEIPDDFTEEEVTAYKNSMRIISGYYVEDTLKVRGAPLRKLTQDSVVFSEPGIA